MMNQTNPNRNQIIQVTFFMYDTPYRINNKAGAIIYFQTSDFTNVVNPKLDYFGSRWELFRLSILFAYTGRSQYLNLSCSGKCAYIDDF